MILEKEQTDRYLRQILIPEISSPGQKKLTQSTFLVYGETVSCSSSLLYYMAASGAGRIICSFGNSLGYDVLFSNIQDLNGDIDIELAAGYTPDAAGAEFAVLIGSTAYIAGCKPVHNGSPAIAAICGGWKGIVQVFDSVERLQVFAGSWTACSENEHTDSSDTYLECPVFSYGLLGTIAAIEGIKLCLGIGSHLAKPLYFNLLNMDFIKNDLDIIKQYWEANDETKAAVPVSVLKKSAVLIVGTGGLGSPAAYGLAAAGIGKLGLVDMDVVEMSNLNRQILHSSSRLGMPKVESAAVFLRKLNPDLRIETYHTGFCSNNAMELLQDYDVIIDGVDNFAARYVMNDACFFAGKPMVEAGVRKFDGLGMTIIPGRSPCYRCIFPNMLSPGSVPSCSEAGILGPVPGIMGFIQSAEAVKLLCGIGSTLDGRMVFFDGLDMDIRVIEINRNVHCPICGSSPTITTLQDNSFNYDAKQD